jgi:hypothetical protein
MFRVKAMPGIVSVIGLTMSPLVASPPSAAADPSLHQVTYTVTAEQPWHAEIYYRDTEPPTFADYSHNPYLYSPKAEADIGPSQPWALTVMLADPDQWAMVAATSGRSPAAPMVHCQLTIDGGVVASDAGPRGALCSLRHW